MREHSRKKLVKKLGKCEYEVGCNDKDIFSIPRDRKGKCDLLYRLYLNELRRDAPTTIVNLKKEFVKEILEKLAK